MNGPRVVPLLAALWLPFVMPERARQLWDRLRRALGLVHEPCDRLHADDVEIVVEYLNRGVWLTLERLTLFERHLLEKFGVPSDAPYLYPRGVRVRAYGPGHAERDRLRAFDCEGVGGGWRG